MLLEAPRISAPPTAGVAYLDDLPDPLVIAGAGNTVTWMNAAAVELFGPQAQGQPILTLLPFVADSRPDGAGAVTDRHGNRVEVAVHSAPVPHGRLYTIHDVTALTEFSRLREELLYSVAHELRGPISVLDGALEVLRADYGTLSAAQFEEMLRTAGRTVARLRGLMDDLLCAGCIRAGRFTVSPRPVPLTTIIDDALDAIDLLLEGRALRVTRDLPAASLTVRADAVFARQVVTNLLTNAIKYSPDGGAIHLSVIADAGQARVTVADEGAGIPEGQLAGLFQRFYRPRREGEQPGIGLGLAIARGIVEAHGGAIGVDSSPGAGTRIWFTLPLAGGRLPGQRPAVALETVP